MMSGLDPVDWIGWLATGVFVASYRFRDQRKLRWLQGFAAVLWIVYGIARHAIPVVIANLLVAGMAMHSSRGARREPTPAGDEDRSRTSLPCN
jgi:hypothetical protein